MQSRRARYDARQAAKSPGDKADADVAYSIKERRLIDHCLAYARQHAGTAEELRALKMIACQATKSKEGKRAADTLAEEAASAELDMMVSAIRFPAGPQESLRRLAPILLERVRKAPEHPLASRVLASCVCPLAAAGQAASRTPPADFVAAADLIVERAFGQPGHLQLLRDRGATAWKPDVGWPIPKSI